MADIFVSYKKEDRTHAERMAGRLREHGFSVWWDDEIVPREAWDAIIEREIAAATAVLVMWTPKAVGSDWVRTEAHYGHTHGKLVPALIEKCQLPLAFSLTQTVDLTSWDGGDADRHWRKLLTWVSDLKASAGSPAERAKADRYRAAIATFVSGEPIVDGAFVNLATPAGTLFQDKPEMPVMRIVPAGGFVMGGAPTDPDRTSVEQPQKQVTLARPFAIGAFPVTNAQLQSYAPAPKAAAAPEKRGLSWFRPQPAAPSGGEGLNPPSAAANHISFDEAAAFAARLSAETGARYRLPSEAEWEYACRAGSVGRYSWGDDIDPSRAIYRWPGATHARSAEPGGFKPNAFGLYDMHGNVREWTQDSWHETYEQTPGDGLPATEGHSAMRVTRGGAWSDPAAMLRSSARSRATQTIRSDSIGLRLVRVLN